DGVSIAFVRQPGRGGVPRSPLGAVPAPWAIWVAEPSSGNAREIWQSGRGPTDSIPRTQGGTNLHWAADKRLVFLSYQDGWPHMYSVPSTGGSPVLLTPGNFMVEFATLTADRRFIVYNANTGSDRLDGDRRHLFKVPVDAPTPTPV